MQFILLNSLPDVLSQRQRKDITSRNSLVHPALAPPLDSTRVALAQAEALRKADVQASDNDSDTRRRKADRRRYLRRERASRRSGGGGTQEAGGKRSRKSRRSSNESSDGSNKERRTKRKMDEEAAATPRRLVKPHKKRAKKLVTGGGETLETPVMLLEDTSSSSSDDDADAGGEGKLRATKGKNKRMAEKPRTNKATVGSGKQKKHGGSSGSGQSVDLLDTLIGNTAPARKKTITSTTKLSFSRQPESRPSLSKSRSADTFERRVSGGAATAAVIGSDERAPPQLVRGGSLDTSSLSLAQYKKGAVRRTEALPPGGTLGSSSTRMPVTSPAEYKIPKVTPKVTPNSLLRKKGGAPGDRQGLKTPAHKGSITKAQDAPATAPAPAPGTSNRIKAQYEKVPHYVGVRRKKTNRKFFVWVGEQLLDGKEYGR